jgi:hypothetical protein
LTDAFKRRSISPASAEINWLNLDKPDITNVARWGCGEAWNSGYEAEFVKVN